MGGVNTKRQREIGEEQYAGAKEREATALKAFQAPLDYYGAMASGDRSKMVSAAAPTLTNLADQYRSAKESVYSNAPRGVAQDFALTQLPVQQAGATAGVMNQAYTSSFDRLADLGSKFADWSMGKIGATNSFLAQGLNAEAANKAANMNALGGILKQASPLISKGADWLGGKIFGTGVPATTGVVSTYPGMPGADTTIAAPSVTYAPPVGQSTPSWYTAPPVIAAGAAPAVVPSWMTSAPINAPGTTPAVDSVISYPSIGEGVGAGEGLGAGTGFGAGTGAMTAGMGVDALGMPLTAQGTSMFGTLPGYTTGTIAPAGGGILNTIGGIAGPVAATAAVAKTAYDVGKAAYYGFTETPGEKQVNAQNANYANWASREVKEGDPVSAIQMPDGSFAPDPNSTQFYHFENGEKMQVAAGELVPAWDEYGTLSGQPGSTLPDLRWSKNPDGTWAAKDPNGTTWRKVSGMMGKWAPVGS